MDFEEILQIAALNHRGEFGLEDGHIVLADEGRRRRERGGICGEAGEKKRGRMEERKERSQGGKGREAR